MLFQGSGTDVIRKYLLTDIYFEGSISFFKPLDLYDKKKKYFELFAKNFMIKLDQIRDGEGQQNFYDYCIVSFLRKKIEKTFNGKIEKQEAICICFPHDHEKRMQKAFEELFKAKILNAIATEKDPFKISPLDKFRNMKVIYWSDYFLKNTKIGDIKKLKERFININDEGISFNDVDIQNPSLINFSCNFDQLKACPGRALESEMLDLVVPKVRHQFKLPCCWAYTVDWNGRETNDIICSLAKGENCKADIRIISATINRRCLKQELKKAVKALNKDLFLKSK